MNTDTHGFFTAHEGNEGGGNGRQKCNRECTRTDANEDGRLTGANEATEGKDLTAEYVEYAEGRWAESWQDRIMGLTEERRSRQGEMAEKCWAEKSETGQRETGRVLTTDEHGYTRMFHRSSRRKRTISSPMAARQPLP